MPFLAVPADEEFTPDQAAAARRFQDDHPGRLSDLDRALLGSIPVFDAYTRWFDVREELASLVGERAVTLLSFAISEGVGAPFCVANFRTELLEAGDDPDAPQVTEAERLLIDWGRAVGADPGNIPEELVARAEATFKPTTRAVLVGFAGLMVAVAVFTMLARLEPVRR